MTLQFRARWNQTPPAFADAPDAAMISLVTPDEDSVRAAFAEAKLNGGFTDARVLRMFDAALANAGPIVSVRSGAHQIEDTMPGGFRLHIGTLFENTNFHVNIAQSGSGRVFIASISWGAPNTANYGVEPRANPPPL